MGETDAPMATRQTTIAHNANNGSLVTNVVINENNT
jgi:hypothetical protein